MSACRSAARSLAHGAGGPPGAVVLAGAPGVIRRVDHAAGRMLVRQLEMDADEERRNADDGNPEEADERVGDRDGERRQRRRHQREGVFGAQDGKDLPGHRGCSAGYSSAPAAASTASPTPPPAPTASTTAPERTSSSAWRISVAYQRLPSSAGGIAARIASSAARVP